MCHIAYLLLCLKKLEPKSYMSNVHAHTLCTTRKKSNTEIYTEGLLHMRHSRVYVVFYCYLISVEPMGVYCFFIPFCTSCDRFSGGGALVVAPNLVAAEPEV